MKTISIVTNCFNEKTNVQDLYERVKAVMNSMASYSYEHIFIDNASEDGTVEVLRGIARDDCNAKLILNTRNFGQIRSGTHALLEATGDAVIHVVADLQDPPELIPKFLQKWEEGYRVVIGKKVGSVESLAMRFVRRTYYWAIEKLASTPQIRNFTGFGLYDREVIETMRSLKDPYPYFRGLIAEFGHERTEIEYVQPRRKRGMTTHTLYSLYDMAMLGITNHSKVPLRIATFTGFIVSMLSACVGIFYLVYKIVFWDRYDAGIAPLVIGLFFFAAVQLFFIGIIGEYVGAIHTQVLKRPLVVEKERVNFPESSKEA